MEERILAGVFLCSNTSNDLLEAVKPEWNAQVELSLDDKLQLLQLKATSLFPYVDRLSDGIDAEAFCKSHFIQPDLFLRIRPGNKEIVLQKLQAANLAFELKGEDCIALPNNSKVDEVVKLNKEAVVQDYSSQRVGVLLSNHKAEFGNRRWNVWDCCAASGGKSIMVKDVLSAVDLTVSDVRESILINLKKRFADAGINRYKSFVADIAADKYQLPADSFDLIIADVPCSGSGTWGRTPEQMCYFQQSSIEAFSHLQKKISGNAMRQLKTGGYFLYITCSVYKQENEEVVKHLTDHHPMEIIQQEVIKGYHQKADTMFAALMRKL